MAAASSAKASMAVSKMRHQRGNGAQNARGISESSLKRRKHRSVSGGMAASRHQSENVGDRRVAKKYLSGNNISRRRSEKKASSAKCK